MTYVISKEELNYYAGFFDGEGCVMIRAKSSKRPYHTLEIVINLTNRNILEDFKRSFGGNVYGTYKSKVHYKDKWQWHIGGGKALAFLKAIYPYLRLKSREAELGIEFQERAKYQQGGALHKGQEAFREAQYILMKRLKK